MKEKKADKDSKLVLKILKKNLSDTIQKLLLKKLKKILRINIL